MKKCIMIDMCRTLWNGTRQPDEETVLSREEALSRIAVLRTEWDIRIFEVEYANPIIIFIKELDEEMNYIGDIEHIQVPLDHGSGYATVTVGEEFPDEIRRGHHPAGNRMMYAFGIEQLP